MSTSRFRVRFHLANGPNYMKWQVKRDSLSQHHDPDRVVIVMRECLLVNQPAAARAIYEGGTKRVCAWIECGDVRVLQADDPETRNPWLPGEWWVRTRELRYNPSIFPHWHELGRDQESLDGTRLDAITTEGRRLFAWSIGALA